MINYSGKIDPHENTIVENLPVGAYVGKVIDATIETVDTSAGSFDRLVLKLDVAEGEHKDHFAKQFASQSGGAYAARWKGIIRYNIPQVGGQYEQGQKKALEHLAWCLQDSNPKYKWDGDEAKIKGLKIGFSVRERDWLMERDGQINFGTTTEIGRVESVNKVLAGEVRPMKKRELRDADKEKLAQYESTQKQTETSGMVAVNDDDLPF